MFSQLLLERQSISRMVKMALLQNLSLLMMKMALSQVLTGLFIYPLYFFIFYFINFC